MEEVTDKLIAEMDELRQTDEFIQLMEVESDTKWDDPGFVLVYEYPYMYVAPVLDEPISETMSKVGYDVRQLTIQIGIVIDAASYFDPEVSEVPGSRELTRASGLVRKHLRRLNKRGLGLTGVRRLVVQSTNYVPDLRGESFLVRAAITTLTVERQYPHEE